MRKIVTPLSSPSNASSDSEKAITAPAPQGEDDNDISTLLEKSIEILRREIRHLMYESAQTKLSKGSSTDLVNYIKLLSDLHEKEGEFLSNLSSEELREILKDRYGDNPTFKGSSQGATQKDSEE